MKVACGDCMSKVECDFPRYVSRHRWVVGTGTEVEIVVVGVAEVSVGL